VKILILKPSSLGDVVQALPVLRLLKRHLPQSHIYWWIRSGLAPLLEGDPDLAGLLRFERKHWYEPRNWLRMWRTVTWVRQQHFDWVIDLQGLARSSTFAWLANGELTIGLDSTREGARGFYDRLVRRPSFHTHAVDWYLGALPLLGVPLSREFEWLPSQPAVRHALEEKWPVRDGPWVSLQPGARWRNKRWPAEYFAQLAGLLAQKYPKLRFAVLGGSEDGALAGIVAAGVPGRMLNLAGQLSLPQMVEWLRGSALMITNDTGPMHVAAALGVPLVALFGPTEPRRTGPYGQLENVMQLDLPCTPCVHSRCRNARDQECLRELQPEIVFQALCRKFARRLTLLDA
jgi:heptosyltransferase I